MLFRIARTLGKTVSEIEHTMSHREFLEWDKYLSQEPHNSIEIQLALLTTVLANVNGNKSSISDFLITQQNNQDEKPTFEPEINVLAAFAAISK